MPVSIISNQASPKLQVHAAVNKKGDPWIAFQGRESSAHDGDGPCGVKLVDLVKHSLHIALASGAAHRVNQQRFEQKRRGAVVWLRLNRNHGHATRQLFGGVCEILSGERGCRCSRARSGPCAITVCARHAGEPTRTDGLAVHHHPSLVHPALVHPSPIHPVLGQRWQIQA